MRAPVYAPEINVDDRTVYVRASMEGDLEELVCLPVFMVLEKRTRIFTVSTGKLGFVLEGGRLNRWSLKKRSLKNENLCSRLSS